MKILRNTLSLSAVLMVLLFASCKKSLPKQLQYIPKDASVVFAVNAKRLNDKLADSKVSIDSLVKSIVAGSKTSPEDIKKWDDLKEAGINWQSDIYGFYQSKGSLMSGTSHVFGAVAAVSSSAKLEAYLKKQKPGIVISKAAGGYSEAKLDNDFIAGWNDDVFILTGNAPANRYNRDQDTATTGNAVGAQLAGLFAQKADESVGTIPAFKDFIKDNGDLLLWVNSSGSLSAIPMLGMSKASDLIKDSYYGGVVNFENGKVEATYKSYTGKALGDIISKHSGPTVDLDMVKKYPSTNVIGYGVIAFDPAIILDIVRFIGLEATANQFLTSMGFTVEDITKAFKGDMAVVVSDLATEAKTNPDYPEMSTTSTSVKFVYNSKVGDKVAYDKICAALVTKGWLAKAGNTYVPAMPLGGSQVVLDDKNIFVASDSIVLGQYKAGTGKAVIADDILSDAKGKTGAMYIDFTKIFKAIPNNTSDSATISLAKATFKDLVVTSDKFDGKVMKGKLELHTLNEKENSLASFIKLGSAIAAKEKADAARRNALMEQFDSADSTIATDSVAVPAEPVQ